jgi:hypothetical protein
MLIHTFSCDDNDVGRLIGDAATIMTREYATKTKVTS